MRLCFKCLKPYQPVHEDVQDRFCGPCREAWDQERKADFDLFCRVLEAEFKKSFEASMKEAPRYEDLLRPKRKPPRKCDRCGGNGGRHYAADGLCGHCRDELRALRITDTRRKG